MTTFPQTIIFKSDGNVAELQKLLPKEGEAIYCYVESVTKKGVSFTVTLDFLNRLEKGKLLEVR